jgi:nucleoside-diphosphate-sugar epimerase
MRDRRTSPENRPRLTVLLTGASGVVGRPLLTRLLGSEAADVDVVCLVHRAPVEQSGATSVRGDVTAAQLGLPDEEYERLAERIDAVVHCAAVTEFNRTDGSLERTNVEGTAHMVALAERAGVPLYHVSTAFLHARADGERGRTAVGYAASKRAGEDVVRRARTPHVILRPSVVIGDSGSGEVAAFQGFYRVAGAILGGAVPMIPFDPSWPIDVIPCDVVADAIATVVERGITSGEFWLTSGGRALTLADAVTETLAFGAERGIAVHRPKFVPPELFDRLIGPVFLEALPPKVRLTAVRLLEFFSAYLSMDTAMPSSLGTLAAMGAKPLPDQRASLRASLGYWAEQTAVAGTAEAKVA